MVSLDTISAAALLPLLLPFPPSPVSHVHLLALGRLPLPHDPASQLLLLNPTAPARGPRCRCMWRGRFLPGWGRKARPPLHVRLRARTPTPHVPPSARDPSPLATAAVSPAAATSAAAVPAAREPAAAPKP
jgi:hypothetical protein